MACARSRGESPSAGTNTATVAAPRSRARRTAAEAPRRTASASPRARSVLRGPRPTSSTRSAGILPPVWTYESWPGLPSNFSLAETFESRPSSARSTAAISAGGRPSPACRPSTSTSARASTGFRVSSARSIPLSSFLGERPGATEANRPVHHVREPVGGIVRLDLANRHPAHLGRVAAGPRHPRLDGRHVVDDHVVVVHARRRSVVGGREAHAVDDAAEIEDADLHPALLRHLPAHRVLDALAQVDQAAGDAPLALRRRLTALDQQHPVAVEDHRPHADARGVGVLAGEGHRARPRPPPP